MKKDKIIKVTRVYILILKMKDDTMVIASQPCTSKDFAKKFSAQIVKTMPDVDKVVTMKLELDDF